MPKKISENYCQCMKNPIKFDDNLWNLMYTEFLKYDGIFGKYIDKLTGKLIGYVCAMNLTKKTERFSDIQNFNLTDTPLITYGWSACHPDERCFNIQYGKYIALLRLFNTIRESFKNKINNQIRQEFRIPALKVFEDSIKLFKDVRNEEIENFLKTQFKFRIMKYYFNHHILNGMDYALNRIDNE